ncbi:hypothetical protein [Arthrobacter sp. AZCC_0090]|uniref:hypothetical protein n=1 Tax=Arthrobacter sp. AZCC_0090 TaxID=2735881 RepID=UPI00161636A1|nr:hypothetical protein [Arthrobacter sp. AZCC_0090]MBB6404505.1 hypothetical protein [Arthrobacter sp. AZCC_0090]
MIVSIMSKVSAWIEAAYFYEAAELGASGATESTRYGWLPALSGVAIAEAQARKIRPGE